LLLLLLSLFVGLYSPGFSFATGTLTVLDNEPVDIAPGEPGPGDNLVFSVRRNATYVVSLAFTTGQPGEIVTHRLRRNGGLEFVGRTPGGPEPRQIALARDGDYAVVANSIANEVAVMSVGDDGLLREVDRKSSGGLNPFDVDVAFNDIVVVANRDSDQINTFHLDRRGKLTPVDVAIAGVDPHVVSVSSNGIVGVPDPTDRSLSRTGVAAWQPPERLVAVANLTDRSLSLFELNRRGELTPLGPAIPTDNMVPRALTWLRRNLFVALDAPAPNEDLIRAFRVRRDGTIEYRGDTPAGAFLTDIEANEDGLFAVTVNTNGPGGADDRDEVRVYRIENRTDLTLDASVQTDNFPPSFKQISTFPAREPNDRRVIVTEFQGGWLRSLIYNRSDDADEEEEDD
jgi:hypothetical protein